MTEWLTFDEIAAYLKRGRSTLYKMARNGRMPASKIGCTWRFDRDAIDGWLRQQSPPGTSGKPGPKERRSRRNAR
ncbi:MAG: helix-turn-helix domain-containing protein [Thermogutta sp.]|nr:helix-turn-helix domain-containing protein [Thermogutta sp.]